MPHYEDYAEYYDTDIPAYGDVGFYLEYAKENGPRTLELACGTGRILLEIAAEGVAIDGLDFSANMLAVCQEKLEGMNLGQVPQLTCSDMADFSLDCTDYGLIYVPFRHPSYFQGSHHTPAPSPFAQPLRVLCTSIRSLQDRHNLLPDEAVNRSFRQQPVSASTES